MEGCTFPLDYEYSKFMFYTSFLFGISFLLAIYLSNIYASIYWFLLCVSSTNHWRNPDYDFTPFLISNAHFEMRSHIII